MELARVVVAGQNHGYDIVCSGYLIEESRALLVHHSRFGKWVPPGGHIEPGELFHQCAEREFFEETGIEVRALSASVAIHHADENAVPLPMPIHMDVLSEGFAVPTIGIYFLVRRLGLSQAPKPDTAEVHDARFVSVSDLSALPTFDQVRSLTRYAVGLGVRGK